MGEEDKKISCFEFPNSPIDGQLYPDPALPGVSQYRWKAAKGAWVLVGETTPGGGGLTVITNDTAPNARDDATPYKMGIYGGILMKVTSQFGMRMPTLANGLWSTPLMEP